MTTPTTPRVDRGQQLVDQLDGVGLAATTDPAAVDGLAPCVLVTPPALAFDLNDGATVTWRLAVVDSSTAPGLDTWRRLDELVEAVAANLPIESAEPSSYQLAPGSDPRPAYLLTLTEGV